MTLKGHVLIFISAWSYSTGFVCATILLSNIGVCLSPLKQGRNFKRLVMFLVALAVGTLAGTGFMVLLPEVPFDQTSLSGLDISGRFSAISLQGRQLLLLHINPPLKRGLF